MNSEVVKNFKVAMKDFNKGKKIETQYVFQCRNCNQEISISGGKSIDLEGSSDILSLHLMTCEKYIPGTGPATAL